MRTAKICVVVFTAVLVIPPFLFLFIVGILFPPPSSFSWFLWTLATTATWTAFLASIVQISGYDLRSLCIEVGEKFQMVKPRLNNTASRDDIFKFLTKRFNYQELQTLCFTLKCNKEEVEFENLGGEGKEDKARELVRYCERRGCIPDLILAINNFVGTDE